MALSSRTNKVRSSMTFLDHLEELRWVLFRSLLALLLFFPIGFIFSDDLISYVYSLNGHTGKLKTLIFYEYFFVRVKFAFYFSFFLSFPYILVQFWYFVAPALYKKERAYGKLLVFCSYLLFFLGFLFGFFLIVPVAISVFNGPGFTPDNIVVEDVLSKYLNFVLLVSFGAGFSSQLPVIIIITYIMGLFSLEDLKKSRPYMIVAIFFLSMILTPPDPITQLIMAIPLVLIFELSLLICAIIKDKNELPSFKFFRRNAFLKFLAVLIGLIFFLYGLIAFFSSSREQGESSLTPKEYLNSAKGRLALWDIYKEKGIYQDFIYENFLRLWRKGDLEKPLKKVLLDDTLSIEIFRKGDELFIQVKRHLFLPVQIFAQWGLNIDGREFLIPDARTYLDDDKNLRDERKTYRNILEIYPYLKNYLDLKKKSKIFAFLKIISLKDGDKYAYWLKELRSPVLIYE